MCGMLHPFSLASKVVVFFCCQAVYGILYPTESETREVKSLDGIWDFRIAPKYWPDVGFKEEWFKRPLSETGEVLAMPVPSSYNDVTQSKLIRDHVGWAWYETSFFIPARWKQKPKQRVVLRFGSVHYNAIVWLNGLQVTSHSGGHLPFEADVTSKLKSPSRNRLTVAVNNTLTPHTIPQGYVQYKNDSFRYPPGYFNLHYNFDFFNYAGIHRPVVLYTTPRIWIDDVSVITEVDFSQRNRGTLNFEVTTSGKCQREACSCYLFLYDHNGALVSQGKGVAGTMQVENVNLWWPYLMSPQPGYLYTLKIQLNASSITSEDIYRLNIGFRTLLWNSTSLMINDKPVYIRGFGKHEDANIRGKGLDLPLVVKDFNLIEWLGANAFRTSHYPYAEEIMDFADKRGIMVIDESPGVALQTFDIPLLMKHMEVMSSMIQRDRNRPSVIMWSIANEPQSEEPAAKDYFSNMTSYVRALDSSRPVTVVLSQPYKKDRAGQFLDIICVNRYFAWYSDPGESELIPLQMAVEFESWHKEHKKPVLITEYGAGSVAGLHMNPPQVFTEDYQVELMMGNFQGFDLLRQKGFFIGEMIWNFADFMTAQSPRRVAGNRKGIFTRERQPKAAAHLLRARYLSLAEQETSGLSINWSYTKQTAASHSAWTRPMCTNQLPQAP